MKSQKIFIHGGYAIKEELKKLGCKWDTEYKAWMFQTDDPQQAKAFDKYLAKQTGIKVERV